MVRRIHDPVVRLGIVSKTRSGDSLEDGRSDQEPK
jgi:hypothetical protein